MLSDFVQVLADYLVSQGGVVSICLLIAAVFLFLVVRFYLEILPLSTELKKAVELVTAQPPMRQFGAALEDVSDQLRNYRNLGPLWREFYETLIFPQPGQQDQSIRNAKEVASCFNENTILAHNMDLPFYASVPNYLTCFGILGTFVGLVAGIYRASQGLASSDAMELRHALEGLLGGASMAFWTSVVGLAASLLFSWFEKNRLHNVRRLIARWNDELEQRIKRVTHEDLAGQQLHELQKQSVFMEEFTTKIAYNIAEALGQKMNDRLVPTLERLTHVVEEMHDHRNQTITDMLEKVVREFRSTLTAYAGEEMRALSQSLQTMNDSLRPLLQEAADVQKQMTDAAKTISNHIMESYKTGSEEFAKVMAETMDHIRTVIGSLEEFLSNQVKQTLEQGRGGVEMLINEFSERIHELREAGQTFRFMMESTAETLKGLRETVAQVNDLSHKIASILGHLSDLSDRMEKIAEESHHTHVSLQSVTTKLTEGMNQFQEVQITLKNQWQSYLSRFENVDGSLDRVFQNLMDGLEAFATKTKDYVNDLDKHTGQITSSFGSAVKELHEAIEDLYEALNSRGPKS